MELALKSDLGLVEAALDVLISDLLKPRVTSSSRPCKRRASRVSYTVNELSPLLWLAHCVVVLPFPSVSTVVLFATPEAVTLCVNPCVWLTAVVVALCVRPCAFA